MSVIAETASSGMASSSRSRARAVWLAWSLCGTSLSLLAATLAMVLMGRSWPLPAEFYPQWDGQLVGMLGAIGAPILGGLIAARRPEIRYGLLWCGFGFAYALLLATQTYIAYHVATPDDLPAVGPILALSSVAWLAFIALIAFLILLFPNGRLPSRRWRVLAWLIIGAVLFAAVTGPLIPGVSGIASIENPYGVSGLAGQVMEMLTFAAVFVILAGIVLSALSVVFRYRRASHAERQQIKWFVFAAAVVGTFILVSGFLGRSLPAVWHSLVEASAFAGLYVGVGIAVLKHRLYDVDLVINRTLVYGALSAGVVGFYIVAVGYLGALFQTERNLLISLVAAGAVAVLFQPLRERVQQWVNRLMYGERDDPYAAVSRLGERLGSTLAPGAVLPAIVETVREALKLPYVAIALPRGGEFEVAVSSGDLPDTADATSDATFVVPLAYGGEIVGQLQLVPRAGERGFSGADRRLVDDLARHAGIAVHSVRVMSDLRRSREELVLAREEERRRLRRDLHDELAPTLAALGLTAATVGELISTDPKQAAEANERLRTAIRATVGEVRRLVYDLRPPALDELGLVGAIRERAARHQAAAGDLRVTVDAPEPLPPLPAAVEVAAYRIVQEALTNVFRHARASACSIRLSCYDDRALEVEIMDDGVGLPHRPGRGVGLFSMRERAAELGGTCEIGPAFPENRQRPGTRVRARLPLGDASLNTQGGR
jgi:signal transduction histidine kinase